MKHKTQDEQHRAYLAQAKAELNELDAQIRVLQAKAERTADARIEPGSGFEELWKRREDLGVRLRELQQTSGEAWKDVQGGLEAAMASMREALRSALERFR